MILFFDTETTGLPDKYRPLDDYSQPSLVQLALQLTDDDGEIEAQASLIVQPGCPIPEKATEVHGISDEKAEALGVKLVTACALFDHMAARADLIVAHNIAFDKQIMQIANSRVGRDPSFEYPIYCTMEAAAPIVNLPPTERMLAAGINRPKPPRLEECIRHFFDEELVGAHDALVDAAGCRRVFFHLRALEGSK